MFKRSTTLILKFAFAVVAVLLFTFAASAQPRNNCLELKYTDFFYLDEVKPNWSGEEIKTMLSEYNRANGGKFFIPVVIYQLWPYHSSCGQKPDERANDLIRLYGAIRPQLSAKLKLSEIDRSIEAIRDDYYALATDAKTLHDLIYTMDDGPLFGGEAEHGIKSKKLDSRNTEFGTVIVSEAGGKMYFSATDKSGRRLWMREMRGTNPERVLKNLTFEESPIENTSLATVIHMVSEGERLRIYLKKDGSFMFYLHSW